MYVDYKLIKYYPIKLHIFEIFKIQEQENV